MRVGAERISANEIGCQSLMAGVGQMWGEDSQCL
jgi:hypothetical protein